MSAESPSDIIAKKSGICYTCYTKTERTLEKMKRVYTLYRVSTAKQVDVTKDDIPMQKIACHEFADRQFDWDIIKEFEEKGISGFKVSAENRDAIQDLKESALQHEFDVLLVFMFDRLGMKRRSSSSGSPNIESRSGLLMKDSRNSSIMSIS